MVIVRQRNMLTNGQSLWQDDERDSSDKEWDIAYAAMDLIAQLGWGNQRGEVEGPAAQLVRDVFVAANLLHKDAMSQIGGNSNIGGECGGSLGATVGDPTSSSTECSRDEWCNNDGDVEGQ